MNGLMAEPQKPPGEPEGARRIRLIIDTTDLLRRALQRRAMKQSLQENRKVTHSEALNAILERALADEISELQGASPPPPKPRKRGGSS
jgi:hypothetical protein